jgi:hypothetical protein
MVAEITFYRLFSVTIWVVPLLVMLAAFGTIAAYTGNIWPWYEVVHESGNRTLLDTVFYFEHAARELPLDVLLGAAIGGSILWAFPKCNPVNRCQQALFVVGIVLVISIIIVGTIGSGGPVLLWDNLLQMHTRSGEALRFGSHWRYHFLSRLMLILISFGLSGLIVLGLQGRQGLEVKLVRGCSSGHCWYLLYLAWFLTLLSTLLSMPPIWATRSVRCLPIY